MRDYRCFYPGPLEHGATVELSRDEAAHLVKVRRLKSGGEVTVLNGQGAVAEARLAESDRRDVSLEIGDVLQAPRSPALALAMALTKSNAFDDTLQRAVELGMTHFFPVQAERSVVQLDEKKTAHRLDRWQRLSIEALKQCERPWLPEFSNPSPLEALLATLHDSSFVPVVLAERREDSAPPLLDVLGATSGRPVCLLIGPEGGWTPQELERLEKGAVRFATLGTAVLRSETSALAALGTTLAHQLSGRDKSPD